MADKAWEILENLTAEGPVTAAHYLSHRLIGRKTWVELDDPDGVWSCTILHVHVEQNVVRIAAAIDPLVEGGTYMDFDADELAIRIVES